MKHTIKTSQLREVDNEPYRRIKLKTINPD